MTKLLLIVTALLEAVSGLALLLIPAAVVSWLFGLPLDTPGGLLLGRIAGAGLVSLGIVCWQLRSTERGGAANGVVSAMLFYSAAVVAILVYAGLRMKLQGTALWPAIVVHQVLVVWCLINLWITRGRQASA
jgi:hypothetical protein